MIIRKTYSSTVQHNVWTFELKLRTSERLFLFPSYLHWKRSVEVSHHSFESTCFVTSVDFQITLSRISKIEVSLLLYYLRFIFLVTLSPRSVYIMSKKVKKKLVIYYKKIVGLYFKPYLNRKSIIPFTGYIK